MLGCGQRESLIFCHYLWIS